MQIVGRLFVKTLLKSLRFSWQRKRRQRRRDKFFLLPEHINFMCSVVFLKEELEKKEFENLYQFFKKW